MYLQGMTQMKIAEEIGVTQAIISKALAICREEWKEKAAMNIDELKQRELAKIDMLELEYWEAWKRSQESVETQRSKIVGLESKAPQPKRLERTVTTENHIGDPRYLSGIQWCITKRCEILGINAPTKFSQTDPTGMKESDNKVLIYLPSHGRDHFIPGQDPDE